VGRRLEVVLIAALAVLQACSTATSDQEKRPESSVGRPPAWATSVAIQTISNKFLVPVVLNEHQAATFLLDTGASVTVITPDLARRLGVELPPGAQKARVRIASGQEVEVAVVRVKSFRVGSARIDNLAVAVYELPPINTSATRPTTVDGFLGVDFIGRFTMTVDPRAGTLTLGLNDPAAR
jgi:predicted aspartyl protease